LQKTQPPLCASSVKTVWWQGGHNQVLNPKTAASSLGKGVAQSTFVVIFSSVCMLAVSG